MSKFFIGPMSKEIVDCILSQNPDTFVFIPSRRQIEYHGGYVNNWTTETFANYVKMANSKFTICRDHGGAMQGSNKDDGFESFKHDCAYFDMIHIDPWKFTKDLNIAIDLTCEYIKYCNSLNKNLKYEIATEESIFYFDEIKLNFFVNEVYKKLTKLFDNIKYIVVQSGTKLNKNNQIGVFSSDRLKKQINVVKKYDKLSKEHNGDYLDIELIKQKFDIGLDSINIAPEFGYIQTCAILDQIEDEKIEDFFNICYNSGKWKNWVDNDFNPLVNKLELIKICGHYVFSNESFLNKIYNSSFEKHIKFKINQKIEKLKSVC